MNKFSILLSLILTFLFTSCFKDANFTFDVPQTQTTITTSKRADSEFFIFFTAQGDSANLDDMENIDYMELKTGKSGLYLVFDPNQPKDIYIMNDAHIRYRNEIRYTFHRMYRALEAESTDSIFFAQSAVGENEIRVEDRELRDPYIGLYIDLMHYQISLDGDVLKEGGALGGW